MKRSKPPSEQVRLARAFKIPPTKRGTAVTITSAFAAIGALGATAFFIPAAGLLAGLGGFEISDRRAIARGLRELDRWGFPIEGYRTWLLADEPTFDVELRRSVDIQMITSSAAAIDPEIEIRRIERGFRVVTRRIALPGVKDGAPPIYLGDRRLLRELYDRILSPLHADVGVVGLRMGERASLPTPASTTHPEEQAPAPVVEGMGAFRDQAMAAPPALQALVVSGGTGLSLTEGTRKLRFRSERVLHAAGKSTVGIGSVLAISFGGMISGVQFGVIGAGVGAAIGLIGGISVAIGTNRQNAHRLASLSAWQGFEIDGYDAWLISGRPLFDLELAGPVDRDWLHAQLLRIEAFSGEANAAVTWVEDVTWLDENVVRIETRPTLIHPMTSKIPPFYGGSHLLFQRCLSEILVPLHAQVGIKEVRMGGYLDRRV